VLSPVIGPPDQLLLRLVVARQVAADRRPALAAVLRAEQHVAAVVDVLGSCGETAIGAVHWKR
jgi:hypothetical protein